jgi:hypothetical protein
MRRTCSRLSAILIIAAGTTLFAQSGAYASAAPYPEVCGDNGSGLCLNNWSGANGIVAMYYNGSANDNMQAELINPCNSAASTGAPDQVTHTCPFTVGYGLNNIFYGDQILQVEDLNSGLCVGTDGDAGGTETACNDATGQGGGDGTIQVAVPAGAGNAGSELINRYWTNAAPQIVAYVQSGGSVGAQLNMDGGTSPSTFWAECETPNQCDSNWPGQ